MNYLSAAAAGQGQCTNTTDVHTSKTILGEEIVLLEHKNLPLRVINMLLVTIKTQPHFLFFISKERCLTGGK